MNFRDFWNTFRSPSKLVPSLAYRTVGVVCAIATKVLEGMLSFGKGFMLSARRTRVADEVSFQVAQALLLKLS